MTIHWYQVPSTCLTERQHDDACEEVWTFCQSYATNFIDYENNIN